MKKSTKFISGLLATLMATSALTTAALSVNAAITPTEADTKNVGDQFIYFEYPTDGTWGDASKVTINDFNQTANVYCLAYAIYGNEYEFFDSGWETSACACTAVEGKPNTYAYNLNSTKNVRVTDPATGKKVKKTLYRFMEENPDIDYGVIFSTSNGGGFQTADLNMNSTCIGDTVVVSKPYVTRENASNSAKKDYFSEWKNHPDLKTKANIGSLGTFFEGQFAAHEPRAKMLADKLKDYLTNPINVGYFNKVDNNKELCDKLGVTPLDVYNQYKSDNAEALKATPEPSDKDTPVEFVRYMGKNANGEDEEKKMATLKVVQEVLGLSDEDVAEPTEAPTTEEPTQAPTEAPTTAAPTEAPTTAAPTEAPTEAPTTAAPTEAPTEAPAEDVNVLAGTSNWLANGWSPDPDSYTMTKGEDGVYTVVVPDVAATPENENYGFKVVTFVEGDVSKAVWHGYNGTDFNVDFRVTDTCDVTVTFNPETGEITVTGDNVTDPEYVLNTINAVGAGGGGFLDDEQWNLNANAMTEVEDGLYEISFTEVDPNVEYQFKFAANGSWDINWGAMADAEKAPNVTRDAKYNSNDNIYFTTDSAADSVDITLTLDLRNWAPQSKEGATYTVTVTDHQAPTEAPTTAAPTEAPTEAPTTAAPTEAPTEAPAEDINVLAGTSNWLANGWSPDPDSYTMTKGEDGIYTVVVPDVAATPENENYGFKVVTFVEGDVSKAVWHGYNGTDFNVDFRVTDTCDVTVTFNPETGEITVTGDNVTDPEYVLNTINAVGAGGGGFLDDEQWNLNANAMTEVEDGLYEISFTEVDPNVEYQFKFAANGSWDINWGAMADAEKAPNVTRDAKYNSNDNIYFTTDSAADSVDITLTLDLRNWAPQSKEGATYTVSVVDHEEAGPTYIVGDVNSDGKVDTVDATLIQKYSIEIEVENFDVTVADVNGDGRISILDTTCVQKYAADYTDGIGNAGKVING